MKDKVRTGQIYNEVYQHSIEDPEGFWGKAAEKLHWYQKWDRVLDDSNRPSSRWFVGGKTNLCYNCVDRHALGVSKDKPAIFWENTAQSESRTITYGELYREVNKFAGVLKNLGMQKGDRVAIYLPMVPEAFIAMLACARIGAIHVVVFAGYGIAGPQTGGAEGSDRHRPITVACRPIHSPLTGLRRHRHSQGNDAASSHAPSNTSVLISTQRYQNKRSLSSPLCSKIPR